MILYDYYRSSASYRVRIALHIKNLPYERQEIHLLNDGGQQFSASFTAINPQQLVPTLVDNDFTIHESLAIIEYLEEQYKDTPRLLPATARKRATVRAFAQMIACDIHPLNNLRVINYLKDNFALTDDQKIRWFHHWMQQGFAAIEKYLQKRTEQTPFCYGNEPSLADVCLIPQVYNALRFNFDLAQFPITKSIYDHCMTLPAFIDAAPK